MFRKLFVFGIVLVLVLGFVLMLDAMFYNPDASDSALGDSDPAMESVEEEVEVSVPVSNLMRGQENILFPGLSAVGL